MRISDWSSDVCSSDLVDGDRQRQVVALPQLLKDQLGEPARVAEDDRRAVPRDHLHHLMHRPAPRMPRPRHRAFGQRSEEHTSELQSLMRISYAVFCLKKKKTIK